MIVLMLLLIAYVCLFISIHKNPTFTQVLAIMILAIFNVGAYLVSSWDPYKWTLLIPIALCFYYILMSIAKKRR